MKCIVLKPSHIQGFLCNFKIEGDISISFGKNGLGHPVYITKICLVKQDIHFDFFTLSVLLGTE